MAYTGRNVSEWQNQGGMAKSGRNGEIREEWRNQGGMANTGRNGEIREEWRNQGGMAKSGRNSEIREECLWMAKTGRIYDYIYASDT